jgi:hypothetical protein
MAKQMKRRQFIALLGAAAWPLAARAQDVGRTYRIGFLVPHVREAPWVVAFFDELRLSGFIEGQNLIVVPGSFNVKRCGVPIQRYRGLRGIATIRPGTEVIVRKRRRERF